MRFFCQRYHFFRLCVCVYLLKDNGQKRELRGFFGQKRVYLKTIAAESRYLIDQHPLSPVFGQKRPGAPDYTSTLFSFHAFLAILCSFPVGYSTTRTDQYEPQEQPTAKFRPGDFEIDKIFSFFKSNFGANHLSHSLSVWEMLRSIIRCVRTNNHTSPNHNKKDLQTDAD